ncbi:MAG TPA: tRNA guanosine(34) transglycosylase Tgt [Thermomicrobiales bacterium]|nr:tRNA guanosine(34) transglycosylase Tgt [Thermomicrobiales bacterium]
MVEGKLTAGSANVLAYSEANGGRFRFDLLSEDRATWARRGRITTARGEIETPVFMPVGTQATVKTLLPEEVESTGAQIILSNTYHLMLRPGGELIREAGGLHRFMQWHRPILTDSGGFQVFSLAASNKVTEEGVRFNSHIDGTRWTMTPESATDLQLAFGSDIMMQLDHVIGLPADRTKIQDATERSSRWLERSIAALHDRQPDESPAVLFGIQQGGMEADLRREHAERLGTMDVAGCAVGGLSVGEPKAIMAEMLEHSTPFLPREKPRYLMGVGSPEDLWHGVARGVDMFDCVLPTRAARNSSMYTPDGRITVSNAAWRHTHRPVDETCDCRACTQYTAAYLHHLFKANEVLGLRLASEHNLRFLARIMEEIRAAIKEGTFGERAEAFLSRYKAVKMHDVVALPSRAPMVSEGE